MPTVTVADAVAAYLRDRHGSGEIGASTARQLRWRLGTLIETCPPDLPIAELDRDTVRAWQRTIGWQRPASRRAYLSTVGVFCAWAVDAGLLDTDPTARIGPVHEPRSVPRALSAAQVARLMAVLPDARARLIVTLMVRLGLRCVEVSRLTAGDYQREAATLLVVGKGSNERILPVPPDVARVLDEWIADHPTGRLVALIPSQISRLVSQWMAAAGLKTGPYDGISAHALRHTAASDLLDRCGNVRTAQRLLGQASLATTDRYLRRASLDQMRAALELETTR